MCSWTGGHTGFLESRRVGDPLVVQQFGVAGIEPGMRQAAQIGSTLRRRVRRHIGRAEFGPQIGRPASGRTRPEDGGVDSRAGSAGRQPLGTPLPRRVRPGRPADPRGSQRSEQGHRSLITSETITISTGALGTRRHPSRQSVEVVITGTNDRSWLPSMSAGACPRNRAAPVEPHLDVGVIDVVLVGLGGLVVLRGSVGGGGSGL